MTNNRTTEAGSPDENRDGEMKKVSSDLLNENKKVRDILNDSPKVKEKAIDRLLAMENTKVKITDSNDRVAVRLEGVGKNMHVTCDRYFGLPLMVTQSSYATEGFGPLLYDILMEVVTKNGDALTSDRASVSDDAYALWQYYYLHRDDVIKKELPVGQWYLGRHATKHLERMEPPKGEELNPQLLPDKNDPIWALWTSYQKPLAYIPTLKNAGKLNVVKRS